MFNIFFIVFIAIFIAFGLAIFITKSDGKNKPIMVGPEDDQLTDDPEKTVGLEDLFNVAERLCKEHQLTIRDRMKHSESDYYWVVESDDSFFYGVYVLGFFKVTSDHPMVSMSQILEFKDFVKSLGGAKGFFFTTGYFTRDCHQPLEGPKVKFYNKQRILEAALV